MRDRECGGDSVGLGCGKGWEKIKFFLFLFLVADANGSLNAIFFFVQFLHNFRSKPVRYPVLPYSRTIGLQVTPNYIERLHVRVQFFTKLHLVTSLPLIL